MHDAAKKHLDCSLHKTFSSLAHSNDEATSAVLVDREVYKCPPPTLSSISSYPKLQSFLSSPPLLSNPTENMVSFHSIVAAALAAMCTPALAYPTNCDWLGCGLQAPLIGGASHQKQLADIKPSDIVANLKALTAKAQNIQPPAQSISLINGPLLVIGLGPFPVRYGCPIANKFEDTNPQTLYQKIIQSYVDIVSVATTDLSRMQGQSPIKGGDDANAIFEAYRDV